jgi:hypothetical protein
MMILLGLTAVLGLGLGLVAALGVTTYQLVDNYGHFGGAIVGALVGLLDPPIVRLSATRWFRRLCWGLVAGVGLGCLGVAIRDDIVERNLVRRVLEANQRVLVDDALRSDLDQLYELYAKRILRSTYFLEIAHELDAIAIVELLKAGPSLSLPNKITTEQLAEERSDFEGLLGRLDKSPIHLWGETVAEDLAALRDLVRSSIDRPINYQDAFEFLVAWRPSHRAIIEDLTKWNSQRMELDRIVRESQ